MGYNGIMKIGERPGGGRRRRSGTLWTRLVLVAVLAVLILLVVLVRPTSEPPAIVPVAITATPNEATETAEATAISGTPVVAVTPSPTLEPTATSTPVPSPTPTLTPTAIVPPGTPLAAGDTLTGRVEQGSFESHITGQSEVYRVYLPPGYDEGEQRYPALYLLHGWPYDETHWADLGVESKADEGIAAGALPPFIIVLPRANSNGLFVNTSGGPGSFEGQLVNELVPQIDSAYRTVQSRDGRAIGGISRGGVWSLQIGFTHPDIFGIVGSHSTALAVNRAPPAHDPFVLVGEPQVAELRIYLSAGDADWARQATWEMHQRLDERGIAHEYVIHPGEHVDPLWAEHIAEYLRFYTAEW